MKVFLLLPVLLIANFGVTSASDPEAVKLMNIFLKKFMKAVNDGNLMDLQKLISPQRGDTNIDAEKMLVDFNGYTYLFRSAYFKNDDEINATVLFRSRSAGKMYKVVFFEMESDIDGGEFYTIKNMRITETTSGPQRKTGGIPSKDIFRLMFMIFG